jgi:hypothetical protein
MRHEHSARSLVKLMQIRKTPSGADGVLHYAPEAFNRIEVVTTVGREQMQPKLLLPVCQSRRELFRPVDTTAVRDHDDLFPGVAKEGHHLMDILAQPLRIKMGDDLIEDFRGAILDGADNAEQHPAGDAAPRAILHPRLAFEAFFAFDLALAQWTCREASAVGFPPPAGSGQGKAPQNGFIFIQQNDLAPAGPVLQGGKFERRPRQLSGFGSEPPRGTAIADVFFLTPRGRSRGSPRCRSGGLRRWRVPDNSTENGANHGGGGLHPRGDQGAWPGHR